MVKLQIKYILFILALFLNFSIQAQRHLIPNVQINKSAVYVGEPVEVSVSIFTSTWFTSGINPGNIKVNGAFTIYFRSLSSSKQINGQTYAGVTLYFNVFPYDDEDLIFPELEFTVETPDKGGYKGIKRVVKTPERTIKVKPIPPGFNKNEWLVTSNMTASDNWYGNMKEVKVGDVLERRITRNVAGTVSELVPPIVWDTIPNVSLYPARSNVDSKKTKTSISATRTDGIRYLFEKEGAIVVPEKVLTWYNPRAKKLYKRTLKEFTIKVLPNPNLGILESIRDSLQITIPLESEGVEAETDNSILGLTIKQFIVAVLGFFIGLFLLFKLGVKINNNLKSKKLAYLNSEKYYFDQFIKSFNKGNQELTIAKLYRWIDALNLPEPTIQYFVSNYGTKELNKAITNIGGFANSDKKIGFKFDKNEWIQIRKNYCSVAFKKEVQLKKDWINP